MAGPNDQQVVEETVATDCAPVGDVAPTGDPKPTVTGEANPQGFVPFFNEEYEFKLGAFGELGPAIRLTIAFGFMLLTAGLLYCATWWWIGIPPMD